MNRQRAGRYTLLGHTLGDQPSGQLVVFALGHQPTDHVAAKDVEHHIERKIEPLDRAAQLGDVPSPNLVRRGRYQTGHRVARMLALGAPLTAFAQGA
jgi:hypothetical protein